MVSGQSLICPDALPSPSTQETFELWNRASAELLSWHHDQQEMEGGLYYGLTLRKILQLYRRCYAYALGDYNMMLGRLMGKSPEPGILSGNASSCDDPQNFSEFCRLLVEDLGMDGVVPTGDQVIIEPGFRPIAVFAGEFHATSTISGEILLNEDGTPLVRRYDFHFARLDKDGTWSDKFSGMSPDVLTFEDDGKPVVNPDDAWILHDQDSSVRYVLDARPLRQNPIYRDRPGVYRLLTIANLPAQIQVTQDAVERRLANLDKKTAELIRGSHKRMILPKARESISVQLG